MGFSDQWGYGEFWMLNLFAFRATDPMAMKRHHEPIGPRNDDVLIREASHAALVIAAWGNHGDHLGRAQYVTRELRRRSIELWCLGVTGTGAPRHPLYLDAAIAPTRYCPK